MLKFNKLVSIVFLGILSGMPFGVLASSLIAWLTDANLALTIITSFAIAKVSYSLKPLWSPFVDYYCLPFFGKFGRRKSWLTVSYLLMSLMLFYMSKLNPHESIMTFLGLSIAFGSVSATFDIACDALRVDKMPKDLQGLGAACAVFGYRIGLLITGAGSLYLAHIKNDWNFTFSCISTIFFFASAGILLISEKEVSQESVPLLSIQSIIQPFKDFFARKGAVVILLTIVFFKIGDAMLGAVTFPFYKELQFTKEEIALVVKVYGLIATIVGSYLGGFIIYRLGYYYGLIISAITQSVTNLIFIWLNYKGHDVDALIITITIENLAAGMGSSALVAYISMLCNKQYSATQYAMLSSSASLFNNTLTIYTGSLVLSLGWNNFFVLTVLIALPGIILLHYVHKKYNFGIGDNNCLQ